MARSRFDIDRYRIEMLRFMADCDVIVCPHRFGAERPSRIGRVDHRGPPQTQASRRFAPFAPLALACS
jgi:hypothetical protein